MSTPHDKTGSTSHTSTMTWLTQRTHPAAWLWLSVAVILLDQATKFLVTRFLELYERVEVLPVLDFTLLHNTGAAFSILAGASGWQRGFFIGLGSIVSVALIGWLWRLPRGERLLPIALALIVGGAVGNVIDRVMHGYVIDFIHAHWARRISPPSTSPTAPSPLVRCC